MVARSIPARGMASNYLDERSYNVGDVIFREGDTSSEIFIVQSGVVAMIKNVGDHEVFLATLERGDFFGELSLLDGQPRHATCYAVTPATLVAVKSGELLIKLRRDPTLALEMLQMMARRLRYLEEQLTGMFEHHLVSREEVEKTLARSEYQGSSSRT